MFYRPSESHGLPHDPFKAIVSPRPIGWISTRGASGSVNLAPFSFFNAFSTSLGLAACRVQYVGLLASRGEGSLVAL